MIPRSRFSTVLNRNRELEVFRNGEKTEFKIVGAYRDLMDTKKIFGVVEEFDPPIWLGSLKECKLWISRRYRKKNPNVWG